MHTESHSQVATTPGPEPNGTPADFRQEAERLRETVKRLESELNEYRAMLYSVLRARMKPEEIVIPDERTCVPLSAFIHELREIVDGNPFPACVEASAPRVSSRLNTSGLCLDARHLMSQSAQPAI